MSALKKFKIEFGGKCKQELLLLLCESKIAMNAYATMLFMDERFVTSDVVRVAEVVEISVGDLGFVAGAVYHDIVHAASKLNLSLCPLELAPQFRLQYLDQQEGSYLTVASLKPRDEEDSPNGFYLSNHSGHNWLRGYRCSSDWLWAPNSKFSFLKRFEQNTGF